MDLTLAVLTTDGYCTIRVLHSRSLKIAFEKHYVLKHQVRFLV